MTSRVHRGFHRVGVVLAALALLLDAVVYLNGTIKSALPLVVVAAALYAAARAVRWVLDGFMTPGPRP